MKEREREFIASFVKTINGKGGKESKIKLGFPTARQTVRFQSKKGRILINEKERETNGNSYREEGEEGIN